MEARGELERATTAFVHAAEVADDHTIPAPAWEAHAALARVLRTADRGEEAEEHTHAAAAIVEQLTGRLKDEGLRNGLRERARA